MDNDFNKDFHKTFESQFKTMFKMAIVFMVAGLIGLTVIVGGVVLIVYHFWK